MSRLCPSTSQASARRTRPKPRLAKRRKPRCALQSAQTMSMVGPRHRSPRLASAVSIQARCATLRSACALRRRLRPPVGLVVHCARSGHRGHVCASPFERNQTSARPPLRSHFARPLCCRSCPAGPREACCSGPHCHGACAQRVRVCGPLRAFACQGPYSRPLSAAQTAQATPVTEPLAPRTSWKRRPVRGCVRASSGSQVPAAVAWAHPSSLQSNGASPARRVGMVDKGRHPWSLAPPNAAAGARALTPIVSGGRRSEGLRRCWAAGKRVRGSCAWR